MNLTNHNFAIASLKTQRISASKARLVAVLLKGKKVSDALAILAHTRKKAAPIFAKLINSAVANAINNHGLEHSNLSIKAAIVNEGPTLKRFRPRAKGSASQILKRTSHFKVVLVSENEKNNEKTRLYENKNIIKVQESEKKQDHMTNKKTDLTDLITENDATDTSFEPEKGGK
ncbi:50S ribosomal protein L22 [Mycoplasma flocculare]|uniref:50S ribosomal protein L22 n=1 Tax=Mesomycoplasma flocculare TaxID=2128 RepID=UPI001370D702|nr:50S ribosomal protein L22 [Mesomycoplasma flocculare]